MCRLSIWAEKTEPLLSGPKSPASEVSQDGLLGKEGKKKNGSSALSRDSGRQNCQSPKREASMLCALTEPELLVPNWRGRGDLCLSPLVGQLAAALPPILNSQRKGGVLDGSAPLP